LFCYSFFKIKEMNLTLTSISRYSIPIVLLLLLSSCNAYLNQPMKTTPARIGETTSFNRDLKSLPRVKEPIVVGVYKFRDQTGQYKPTEIGSSWSTAVTQGATSMLITALEDSKWFVPIERENIGNLLNERKIIRSSRMQYSQEGDQNEQLIRPLLYAGLILEGGILSYDANIITGGAGLRYFGTGGGGQYRQDRVTVCIRAISTQSGEILKSVYTSKTLLSQSVDVGIFRYVSFRRLLEFETGITHNEPADMAVREAIEKAVYSLLMEGIIDGLWEADADDINLELAIRNYKNEQAEMEQTDYLGSKPYNFRKKTSAIFSVTGSLLNGDYPNSILKPGVEIGINHHFRPSVSLATYFGYSGVANKNMLKRDLLYFNANLQFTLIPTTRFSPIVYGGGGVLSNVSLFSDSFGQNNNFYADVGVGALVMLSSQMELQIAAEQIFLFTDGFDTVTHGKYNDQIWRMKLGFRLHFGKNNIKY
jgi:curli production assembly/transport component CsgG